MLWAHVACFFLLKCLRLVVCDAGAWPKSHRCGPTPKVPPITLNRGASGRVRSVLISATPKRQHHKHAWVIVLVDALPATSSFDSQGQTNLVGEVRKIGPRLRFWTVCEGGCPAVSKERRLETNGHQVNAVINRAHSCLRSTTIDAEWCDGLRMACSRGYQQ